jgi:hypothetical protein
MCTAHIIDIFSPGRIGPVKPGSIDDQTLSEPAHGRKKPGFEKSECIQD